MPEIDGTNQLATQKKILTAVLENCNKSALKHILQKYILLIAVNLSKILVLYFLILSHLDI